MIGFKMKLVLEGKVIEEIEITDERDGISRVNQIKSSMGDKECVSIITNRWDKVVNNKFEEYRNWMMSNEKLELSAQSFLYDPEEYKRKNPFP